MRFGILRRFSYLIHRRTRSDSAIISRIAQPTAGCPSSLSLDGLQQCDVPVTPVNVLPPAPVLSPLLPICVPPYIENSAFCSTVNSSVLSPERFSPRPSIGLNEDDSNSPLLRLSAAQKHVAELATQSSQLKASIEALQVQASYAEQATRKAKDDLDHARILANRQKRKSTDLEFQINARRQELTQCEAFAKALSEADLVALAGLHSSSTVSSEPTNATDFEEIVVEAIREASSNDASIWSKIVSLVIGPRAPDNYVNAINMTLEARQELRHWRKVSNFWRRIAKENDTDAPTPSTSNLSEIQVTLSDERKKAVEDLREKRKTLGLNTTCTSSSSSGSLSPPIDLVKHSFRPPDSHPSFTSVMSTMSNLASSRDSSTTQSTRHLAPLASEVFKQDLISSHSSHRLFSSSSHNALWSTSATRIVTKPSDKSLGKRKAGDVHQSLASMPSADISFESNVGEVGNSLVDSSSSNSHSSSWASFNSVASHQSTPIWMASKSSPDSLKPAHNSLKSAERALESFERICHRFSSGSNVGSLHNISEESSFSEPATIKPQFVVHISDELGSGSGSSGGSSLFAAVRSMGDLEDHVVLPPNLPKTPVLDAPLEGETTLVESWSGSNRGLSNQEHDMTLIEAEPPEKEEGMRAFVETDINQEPSPMKKTRLPIFRIPNRLSQMSRMTGSSSKRSFASFRSRNSSSTISTVASKELHGPRLVKGFLTGFKPISPLRIVKKGQHTASSVHSTATA